MKCKFCQSEIDDKCIVCPNCKRDLVPIKQEHQKVDAYGKTDKGVWIFLGAAVAVLILVMLFAKCTGAM